MKKTETKSAVLLKHHLKALKLPFIPRHISISRRPLQPSAPKFSRPRPPD